MTDLRNFAIAMAVAAGLTTASVAFAQAPRSPADPNSPGAVVTPYSNKAYKGRDPGTFDRSDTTARDRAYGGSGSAGSGGSSTESPTSPRPPRSDGGKHKE